MPLPISPYAVAKLASEGYCRSFHAVYGLQTVALRYFNVFGPHQDPLSQYAAVIPKFLSAAAEGQRPTIFGDGTQTRDFTFVADVVQANRLAMEAPGVPGRVFNIACGRQVSLNEVVSTIEELLGQPMRPLYAEPRVGDVQHSMADITQAREQLGFEPSVDFREGMLMTVNAFSPTASHGTLQRSA
jgi:UDP-glucose 4-epimerase